MDRPFNRLLRDEELKKFKTRNLGNVGLNQAVRDLGVGRKKEWGLWFLFFGGMSKEGYNLREKERKSIF